MPDFAISSFARLTLFGLLLFAAAPAALSADDATSAPQHVRYNEHIRKILSAKCLSCHGPDEAAREADLRLDDPESALASVIVPGKPDESELVRRIESTDEFEQMPPPDSNKTLTAREIELLRRWIADGAEYEQHWSFVPPQQPPLPRVQNTSWPRNGIDHFILAKLEAAGLEPSPEADRYTLVRRLYLDLIGLPPTIEQAERFVHSDDPLAYDKLVDELLASPRYGERWARRWLDMARYADTNGYEKDRPRTAWPYRDWVIDALNADMPFDQFTIEQLAGDMLPNPTQDQLIATGFHRNTMLNEEGGIDPLEYRFYSLVDRVNTTSTIWLGLTLGCAQCHTHKYDPITHTEYYGVMAFLNNVEEPNLELPDRHVQRQRAALEERLAALRQDLTRHWPIERDDTTVPPSAHAADPKAMLEAAFEAWIAEQQQRAVDWQVLPPDEISANLAYFDVLDDGSVLAGGDISKRDEYEMTLTGDLGGVTALRLEALPHEQLPAKGPGRTYYEGRQGDFFLSELEAETDGTPIAFSTASATHEKLAIGGGDASAANAIDGDFVTGWSASGNEGRRTVALFQFAEPLPDVNRLRLRMTFERHYAAPLGRFRLSVTRAAEPGTATGLADDLVTLLARGEPIDADARGRLKSYFLATVPELAEARKPIEALERQRPEFPTAMIFQERPPGRTRETRRYHRGEFLQPQEVVEPHVPAVLHDLPDGAPTDRLTFARWLVDPANPLVGRVTTNRMWERFFGRGLVETVEDFGLPGAPPTHPELLDWLAVEFVRQGWSLKQMHRLIVTSATYRQSAAVSERHAKVDPENRLWGRAPRYRLDAEILRDYGLVASGRLSDKIGGPSVFPPQPESVTTEGAYGKLNWETSTGEDRYRRGLYTFAKRTAPFAAFLTLDAPSGEACVARRPPSNTPLQSLTLLNDDMFVEFAIATGKAVAADNDGAPLRALFQRILVRPPQLYELEQIRAFHDQQLERLQAGDLPPLVDPVSKEPLSIEATALALVARALFNTDEALTRQ